MWPLSLSLSSLQRELAAPLFLFLHFSLFFHAWRRRWANQSSSPPWKPFTMPSSASSHQDLKPRHGSASNRRKLNPSEKSTRASIPCITPLPQLLQISAAWTKKQTHWKAATPSRRSLPERNPSRLVLHPHRRPSGPTLTQQRWFWKASSALGGSSSLPAPQNRSWKKPTFQ